MEIGTHQNDPAPGSSPAPEPRESAANSFAAFIDPALGAFAVADSSSAGEDSAAAAAVRADIEFIRQNGLIAFIEDNLKSRREEPGERSQTDRQNLPE